MDRAVRSRPSVMLLKLHYSMAAMLVEVTNVLSSSVLRCSGLLFVLFQHLPISLNVIHPRLTKIRFHYIYVWPDQHLMIRINS